MSYASEQHDPRRTIAFTVDQSTYAEVQRKAQQQGLSIAAYVKALVTGPVIVVEKMK